MVIKGLIYALVGIAGMAIYAILVGLLIGILLGAVSIAFHWIA